MVISGLIVGFVSLLMAVGVTLLSPMCVPCMAPLLGVAAGFLAGVFDKPPRGTETTKAGALAGAISGMGGALGLAIGGVMNAVFVGPEGAARLARGLGRDTGYPSVLAMSYWAGLVSATTSLGLLDVVLKAGTGVVGSLIWGATAGKTR